MTHEERAAKFLNGLHDGYSSWELESLASEFAEVERQARGLMTPELTLKLARLERCAVALEALVRNEAISGPVNAGETTKVHEEWIEARAALLTLRSES